MASCSVRPARETAPSSRMRRETVLFFLKANRAEQHRRALDLRQPLTLHQNLAHHCSYPLDQLIPFPVDDSLKRPDWHGCRPYTRIKVYAAASLLPSSTCAPRKTNRHYYRNSFARHFAKGLGGGQDFQPFQLMS